MANEQPRVADRLWYSFVILMSEVRLSVMGFRLQHTVF